MESSVALDRAAPVHSSEVGGQHPRRFARVPTANADGLPESGLSRSARQRYRAWPIAESFEEVGRCPVKGGRAAGMRFRPFRYYVKKYNLR